MTKQATVNELNPLVAELEGYLKELSRAYAGFSCLRGSLLTKQQALPEGERARGPVMFEFVAPSASGEPIKCAMPMQKINPEHCGHVLIPMINAYAEDLLNILEEINTRIATVQPLLANMVGAVTQEQTDD